MAWDWCNKYYDDGIEVQPRAKPASIWVQGATNGAVAISDDGFGKCYVSYDYKLTQTKCRMVPPASCVSVTNLGTIFVDHDGNSSCSLARKVPKDPNTECIDYCAQNNFYCTNKLYSTNQMFTCSQGCLIRGSGSTSVECRARCDRNGSSGCAAVIGNKRYSACAPRDSCPASSNTHWKRMPEECKVGCDWHDGTPSAFYLESTPTVATGNYSGNENGGDRNRKGDNLFPVAAVVPSFCAATLLAIAWWYVRYHARSMVSQRTVLDAAAGDICVGDMFINPLHAGGTTEIAARLLTTSGGSISASPSPQNRGLGTEIQGLAELDLSTQDNTAVTGHFDPVADRVATRARRPPTVWIDATDENRNTADVPDRQRMYAHNTAFVGAELAITSPRPDSIYEEWNIPVYGVDQDYADAVFRKVRGYNPADEKGNKRLIIAVNETQLGEDPIVAPATMLLRNTGLQFANITVPLNTIFNTNKKHGPAFIPYLPKIIRPLEHPPKSPHQRPHQRNRLSPLPPLNHYTPGKISSPLSRRKRRRLLLQTLDKRSLPANRLLLALIRHQIHPCPRLNKYFLIAPPPVKHPKILTPFSWPSPSITTSFFKYRTVLLEMVRRTDADKDSAEIDKIAQK